MARRPALSIENLTELDSEKLARLVLDETERNAGFKRQVSAALAAKSGPEAVAKLIDRRLAGLERAHSFIEWERTRAFRDDLQSLVDTIGSELASASVLLATDRLLRFVATHERVFDRVDDSSGHVQDVYYLAIAEMGALAGDLSPAEAAQLPDRIMAALGETSHGYLRDLAEAVIPHLADDVLEQWDHELIRAIGQRETEEAGRSSSGWQYSMTSQWRDIRKIIARQRGDLDLLIELESRKAAHMQDNLGLAAALLQAGRAIEALDWVRRPGRRALVASSGDDDEDLSPDQASLEARILEALGEKDAARALRWACFGQTLSADILRQHLNTLPDFEDIEELDRAFDLALQHPGKEAALRFLLGWPRLDLAARLITDHHDEWDGRDYHILPQAAAVLEHEYPLAATILYRALLDSILARAKSKAYPHGVKYLRKLNMLAKVAGASSELPRTMMDHADYSAALRKAHVRKIGFWRQVEPDAKNPDSESGMPSRGRAPHWVVE
ncbi:DUF6880 family protein [Paracoccus onubensis]|uniref:Uncharacterized protein n=1 Tax=Paracoccus onubensis TaxID=1675788 RepID=A0A418T1T1_9RHOB|nr:DUF6880 family protein [Paracoccus onubensis]RJE87161.1 hypothetical protein D3P04_05285 [Paracoccus onubensis]